MISSFFSIIILLAMNLLRVSALLANNLLLILILHTTDDIGIELCPETSDVDGFPETVNERFGGGKWKQEVLLHRPVR